jgi:hypothetical protein
MLKAELPEDASYTYGNRLRGHFQLRGGNMDTLQAAIDTLCANPETRHAYTALWDNGEDLTPSTSAEHRAGPCLVAIALRRSDGALSLTATYRAHNLLIAWLENVYGLMAIQRYVAERVGMSLGPITVISHSLGIDPRNTAFERARALAERWTRDDDRDHERHKYSLRGDPNGYFVVTVDEAKRCIVAEHRFEGVLVKRYTGKQADKIAREISGDMSVSLVSHALWLGLELASKEAMLHAHIGGAMQDIQEPEADR